MQNIIEQALQGAKECTVNSSTSPVVISEATLEVFAQFIAAREKQTVLSSIFNLLDTLQESAGERHNYFKVVKNLIAAEYYQDCK